MKIRPNAIICKLCGDMLVSEYTHDFKLCSCKAVGIDGGLSYTRLIGSIDNMEAVRDYESETEGLFFEEDSDSIIEEWDVTLYDGLEDIWDDDKWELAGEYDWKQEYSDRSEVLDELVRMAQEDGFYSLPDEEDKKDE